MLNELDSGAEIARLTSELLRRADAYGRLPTPVGDLLCAAHLTEPTQSFLSLSAIAQAPAHLRPILLRVGGKVHAALDRRTREVHINKVIDIGGHNAFKRLHETCHDLFYWQHVDDGRVGFADNEWSLSPRTKVRFEQEANQGAAELLFQRDYFGGVASDWVIGFGAIVELASMFGASLHATFRRYIECHRAPLAGVVLGCNPRTTEPLTYWRYETTCSASWLQRFDNPAAWPRILQTEPYAFVEQAGACSTQRSIDGYWWYPDRNQAVQHLRVEAWTNSYRKFVLIWVPQREFLKRRRVVAGIA